MATEAQINAIVGLYVAYFDRAPDPAGLQFWIDQLDNGRDFSTISQDFADSAEAKAIYPYLSDDNDLGTISPVAFITNIYANLFGRVPDQAGLEFWTDVLESGAVDPGDMVEAISLGAKDNLNDNGFFDRSVLDNKIECARYFTEQAGEIGTFPQGDQAGQFEIGSPEYLAAVGAVGAAGNSMGNLEECQDFIDTLLREFIPNSSFTLCPIKIEIKGEEITELRDVTETVLYWGFANPGENASDDGTAVLSNGIPAEAFFGPGGYLETITKQDFAELSEIDVDFDEFSIIDFSSVTNITLSATTADLDDDSLGVSAGVLTFLYPDGSSDDIVLGQAYFDFLCKLILDDEGNTRFYEQEVAVGVPVYLDADGNFTTTPQPGQEPVGTVDGQIAVGTGEFEESTYFTGPLVLTPTENNGGTKEPGFTSDDNDFIQVGIVDLLHGAIIDGGGGYNTLEIDAKGHFAQPKALNNIQQISIHNLPNIYTIDGYDDDIDGNGNSSQYPDVVGDESGESSGDNDTIIDLSRATELENVTITEGDYNDINASHTDAGDLTVVGLRNNATLTLQGGFSEDIYVRTSEGLDGDGFKVILENVNSYGDFEIADNSAKLHLVSSGGGNNLYEISYEEDNRVNHLVISGDAHLFIEEYLDEFMEDEAPVLIDASANTGGVDLRIDDLHNITFIGSQGDDRFSAEADDDESSYGPDYGTDEEINIISTVGNNHWDIDSYVVNVTDGDGNITLKALAGLANVALGGGNNTIATEVTELHLTVGDGDNFIDVDMSGGYTDSYLNKERFNDEINIVAGDGANEICVEVYDNSSDDRTPVVNITAGDGGNDIKVETENGEEADVTINTGSGADNIKVAGSSITINSGGGGDTITLVGTDDDFTFDEVDTEDDAQSGGDALQAGDITENIFHAGVLLNIDTGAGSADIHLGMDGEVSGEDSVDLANMNVIAKDGSVITGEDITLHVNTYANLIAASLTGVTSVVLDDDAGNRSDSAQANDQYLGDRAQLTLTVDQFLDIGAENFSVDGAIFNTHAFIKLIVTEDTNLNDLGLDNLQRNIDLYLEINDGAEVTMTAEQLHTRIARDGITLAEDGNTDLGAGSVVIKGGGMDFDPFNTNDMVKTVIGGNTYYGGSLSQDFMVGSSWYNVSVQSVFGGYDRPADVPVEVYFTIDADITAEVGAFDTWHNNVEIVGNQDITFTGPIQLGLLQGENNDLFAVDFSSLEGNANGLTLGNFEMVGAVYGNSTIGYETEVFVEIAGNADDGTDEGVGFDDDDDGNATNDDVKVDDRALISQGVQQYTVTVIDGGVMMEPGSIATIRLCDDTEDLETIALRGNWNDTLEILDAAHGLNFELQTGGTLKREGPTHTANVGKIDASFKWDHADVTVDIIHSVDGDTRPIDAAGIVIDNADTITVNSEGPAVTIGMLMGSSLNTVNLNADGDMTVEGKFDVEGSDSVDLIDASGVVGVFTGEVDGQYVAAVEDDPMTMEDESAPASGGGDFSFIGAQGGSVLTLCNVDDDAAEGVTIDGGAGGVHLIIDGDNDLDESTLTNVTKVTLLDGASLQLTMDQVDAIGSGNFMVEEDGSASLTIKGLNDQEFALANFPDFPDGLAVSVMLADLEKVELNPLTDLTGIASLMVNEGTTLCLTMAQFQQLDGDGTITGAGNVVITGATQADVGTNGEDLDLDDLNVTGTVTIQLAEDLDLSASDINDSGPVVDTFEIGDGMTLTLDQTADADGVAFIGGADSTLRFMDVASGVLESIDASGFDVDTLLISNTLVADRNVDRLFFGLPERVTKEIYTGIDFVEGVTQNVIIEEGTTVPGFLAFVKPEADVELRVLNLTLEGGTEIEGDLLLSSTSNELGRLDQEFQELNIVTTGTAANFVSGETANIITGNITSQGTGAFITGTADGDDYLSVDGDLLTVNISGDQEFVLTGSIIFEEVTADGNAPFDDGLGVNDNTEATATLNVNSSADVTIGDLDTGDSDVDFLVVNNDGTGDLTIGISSTATVDPEDVITLNGSATGTDTVIVSGGRDFSGDTIEADWDFIQFNNNDDGADVVTVVVTQQQFNDIGVGGFLANGDGTAIDNDATLNIVDFDGSVAFDATGLDGDIDIDTITMQPGVQTLNPATNLTGVGKILVPEGGTLNLTAAQYQQLAGDGGMPSLKICSVDGSDANSTIDAPITVNITDLTQADIDAGPFNLGMIDTSDDFMGVGNVTVSLAESVELSGDRDDTMAADPDVVQTAGGVSNVEFILSDGQDLGLATFLQADGLEITGTGTTDVFFRFADENGSAVTFLTTLDASGYDVTQLHALNVFVGGRNVEYLIDDLDSDVKLVIYFDPEDLGMLNLTDRMVIVEPGTTIDDISGTVLAFNDLDTSDEVFTVMITALGGTILDGNIVLGTTDNKDAGNVQKYLQSFTYVSEGDGTQVNAEDGVTTSNVINGGITPFPVGAPAFLDENNLLDVNLMAENDLFINGTIYFNGRTSDDDSASLDVSGTAPITIQQVDVEATMPGAVAAITEFSINNTGSSTLTISGASNSINLSSTVETLLFTGTGDIVLDTTASTAFGDSGVNGPGLSTMDSTGLTGNLSLGVVENVDDDDFSFTSGTGVTTMTMAYDDLAVGATTDDTGWSFDFTSAAAGSQLTLGLDTSDGAASNLTFAAMSDLNIDMGPNGVLCINQDVNFTDVNLSLSATQPIVIKDGATVTMTAEQASGLTFVGENGAASTGVIHITDLGDDPVDLSGISSDVAGYVFLVDNDVTLDPATDLGPQTIGLVALDPFDFFLNGQTIRMSTEDQASGQAIDVIESVTFNGDGTVDVEDWDDTTVAGDSPNDSDLVANDEDSNGVNSTNVIWLFDSVTAPLETFGFYDPSIGRVWFSADLLESEGGDVENLFDSLANSILRVDFNTVTELDIQLASSEINRIIELSSFTELPSGIIESDDGFPPEEHIENLTIFAGGEVEVGDVVIGDMVADPDVDPTTPEFMRLIFNSMAALGDNHPLATEDYVNDNDGIDEEGETVEPINLNLFGDVLVGATSDAGIDLLDVTINTLGDYDTALGSGNPGGTIAGTISALRGFGSDFQAGTIFYDSEDPMSVGLLTITGENDVFLKAVDSSDADVVTVTVDTSGHSGTLNWTGGSPAFIGGDDDGDGNTETLTFTDDGSLGVSTVWLGHVFDEGAGEFVINTDVGGDAYAGIDASTLSNINTFGHVGTVNLGVVADIDSENFRISNDAAGVDGDGVGADGAGVGTVNLCLGEGLDADGILVSPELSATGRWEFDNGDGGTGVMNLEMKAVTFNTGGELELDGVTLTITGDVDLSPLDPADISLSDTTIAVAAGGCLTISVEQALALAGAGITITGSGIVKVEGNADDLPLDFSPALATGTVDLSGLELTAADADGRITLALFPGHTDDDGTPHSGQYVIGSPFDDTIGITSIGDDTVEAGADTGSIGVSGDPSDDVLGDDVQMNYGGSDTIIVDQGFDREILLDSDISVQVASGTEFSGLADGDLVVTSDTSNDGGVGVIQAGSNDVDMSAATGSAGWTLIGGDDPNANELTGSDFDDVIIDGLAGDADNDTEEDTFTGNDGTDLFIFNIGQSTPATATTTVTTPALDYEYVAVTAGGTESTPDSGQLTIVYTLNGATTSVNVNESTVPGADMTSAAGIAAAIIARFGTVTGIDAVSEPTGTDVVRLLAEDGGSLNIDSITPTGYGTAPTVVIDATQDEDDPAANGPDDQAQVSEVTFELPPGEVVTADETYTVTLTRADGTFVTASYTATATDDLEAVANGLISNTEMTGLDDLVGSGGTMEFSFANTSLTGGDDPQTIEITDDDPDDGGFEAVGAGGSGIEAVSFSTLLGSPAFLAIATPTLADADADEITDFLSGTDSIDFDGLVAGTSANFSDDGGTQATDFDDALTKANAAVDGTVIYYMTSFNDGTDDIGLLFVDGNADGDVDGVVQLTGVTEIDDSDIV